MDRRAFVHAVGASVAGARAGLPELGHSPGATLRLKRIGLELYSVRDAMRKDPEGTFAIVRAMGYDQVELLWSFGNFGRTTEQVRSALRREGLRAPSAHVSPDILRTDWPRSLDAAKLLGHEYLIVPSLPIDEARPLDSWREWADRFNEAGAAARKAGLWLAFHNEPDHVHPVDGQVPYDLFVQRTDPAVVRHQLDVGNMAMGGGDPQAYLGRYRDRYWSFHLKDVAPDGSHDTELGAGRLDFRRLLAAIPDLAKKPCYVEQEGSADPIASARLNFAYLRALDF